MDNMSIISVVIELHSIGDPVNACTYRRQTHYGESFYTRKRNTLFDVIKTELTINKKMISTYILHLKGPRGTEYILLLSDILVLNHRS